MPQRERYLWICINERPPENPKGSCAAKGSKELQEALKKGIATRGLRLKVRACESSCLDLCWVGPSIAVMPDQVFYGRVKHEDVGEILDSLEQGTVVERLRLSPEDFDEKTAKKE